MKLTNDLRDRILANVMKATFEARQKKLDTDRVALGDKAYMEIAGKYHDIMTGLPSDFFPWDQCMKISFDGSRYNYTTLPLSTRRPLPYNGFYFCTKFDAASEIGAAITALERRKDKLELDRKALKAKVNGILQSVTTVKRLIDTWPEVERYMPKSNAPVVHLPAVVAAEVNQAIEVMQQEAA